MQLEKFLLPCLSRGIIDSASIIFLLCSKNHDWSMFPQYIHQMLCWKSWGKLCCFELWKYHFILQNYSPFQLNMISSYGMKNPDQVEWHSVAASNSYIIHVTESLFLCTAFALFTLSLQNATYQWRQHHETQSWDILCEIWMCRIPWEKLFQIWMNINISDDYGSAFRDGKYSS